MQNMFSPLANIYQTQLEASRRFAEAIFSGTEKIDRVIISATQRIFNEQLNLAQAFSTIRDPRSATTTLQSNYFARNPTEAVNYQKEIMRIFAEMQNDMSRSYQEYIQQLSASAANSAALPLEAAQEQANDAMLNPMTSMFSVWESAFKEVAALAKKNMAAARSTIDDTVNVAVESTGDYVAATSANMNEAKNIVTDTSGYLSANVAKAASVAGEDGGSDEKRTSQATTGSKRK